MLVQVVFYNGVLLYIELLVIVEFEVIYIEFGLQGDWFSVGIKLVIFQIGVQINVLLFINIGDKLKVDLCDGSYLGWVNV